MPADETGDFELVLGNKQLLSVFFVMVVLLGVFFTMGYIVGRNTAEVEVAAAPPEPLVVEAGGEMTEPIAVAAAPDPTPSQPETTESLEAAQAEPPPAPTYTPKPKPTPTSTSRSAASEPPTGTVFMQVAATSRTEADLLLEVLEGRGFQGRLASVPGQDLYRVLIGPLANASAVSETRSALQDAGFEPFTRRY